MFTKQLDPMTTKANKNDTSSRAGEENAGNTIYAHIWGRGHKANAPSLLWTSSLELKLHGNWALYNVK